jgi:prepilin-type processing-associated H-X9-DG protein
MTLPRMPAAVVFDMDGLLFDTETLYRDAIMAAAEGGHAMTLEVFRGMLGSPWPVNRQYLLDALGAGFRNFMFADGHSPLLSDDGKGAKHVLMPLRYDGPPRQQPAEAPDAAAQAQTPANTATDNTNPAAAAVPQPEQQEKQMKQEQNTAPQPEQTALERLQAAYEVAKGKVRDAQAALADVAAAIRDAVKEERKRSEEVAAVRAGLAKLQSIKV